MQDGPGSFTQSLHKLCVRDQPLVTPWVTLGTCAETRSVPVVMEILTWKDSDAPDSVPGHHPDIKKIWDRLNALVEKRGEKSGIDIDEMDIVVGATRPRKRTP